MADPQPGPEQTPKEAAAARQRHRRPILAILAVFAAYAVYSLISDSKPGWLATEPSAFPAAVDHLRFGKARFDAKTPHIILLKRTGKERKLPPRRLAVSMSAKTVARYRCRKPARCPWITIAPLTCRLDDAAPSPCGLELFDIGQTGTKLFPRPRCRLTRPGVRDLKVGCPRALVLGEKLKAEQGGTSGRPKTD